jgi:Leucine-rich repeat (LRR) protein
VCGSFLFFVLLTRHARYASYNQLASLPKAFVDLSVMEELYINDNQLKDVTLVSKMTRLRLLDISHNHLESLPASLAALTLLKELRVGGNVLTSLFPGFLVGCGLLNLF